MNAVQTVRADRGRYSRLNVRMVLSVCATLALVLTAYVFFTRRALETKRHELLAELAAGRETVGQRWDTMRAELEGWALGEALTPQYLGDHTDAKIHEWDYRSLPGLYARVRLSEVHGAELGARTKAFQAAIRQSTHDGLTSCLFRPALAPTSEHRPVGSPLAPMPARSESVLSEQPWNLKFVYQNLVTLTPGWVQEVKDAEAELRLRAFTAQWEQARDQELPKAVEMMTSSRFFLLVVDEDAAAATALAKDGAPVTMDELQQVKHPVRVQLYDLREHKLLLRRRLQVDMGVRMAGDARRLDAEGQGALNRQVHNCQLGRELWLAGQAAPTAEATPTAPGDAQAPR